MSGRILVVDDLPQNIRLLEAVLEPEGYEVVAASSGTDALERARCRAASTWCCSIW